MSRATALGFAALLAALPAWGQDSAVVEEEVSLQSPRTGGVAFRLGGYRPLVDEEEGLNGTPYKDTFGDASLLLFEAELQRYFYQGFGTAGIGLSAGYGEKFAPARLASGAAAGEQTAIKVIPLGVNAFYKFDYAAFEWGIPLVPYGKLGLIYTPWWITKGSSTETVGGNKGSGGKWGWGATGGLAFMLDVLEPRFARDFDSDLGVNHSYLFAEYTYADVNNFGAGGLNLSSRRWMFGLALDY
ncbi:MXAN_2562 family outer membrane beta-barrel protein [Pyxidicoccus trucidator]|uniref:MXAN_2562 family outer membrane beta-barrel protein n=1 Tax=Pyxidicoccus trucidator TaxID=2709662 RepID=UPI0013DA3284|nr:MXAN_2562 family outer membrane beta-barrel protein [Pyxidicoccus trucidator]